MSDKTGIEWTDATWNPVRGCSRVSEGCRNCYAERVAARFSGPGQPYAGLAVMRKGEPRWTGKVRVIEEHLRDPLRWTKPRRVFVNSMSDLFHEELSDETIDRVFAVMALAEWHTFQILTKRPERMLEWFETSERFKRVNDAAMKEYGRPAVASQEHGMIARGWPLRNVWMGVSAEDQRTAEQRVPLLVKTPAVVRFVSAEPLLGKIDLRGAFSEPYERRWGIDWVIAGGESGPHSRPMDPEWARALRDQCRDAGAAFFFKQWGDVRERGCALPGHPMYDAGLRVGAPKGGGLLDGREWRDFPTAPGWKGNQC